jgi:hypothetical protein
MIFRLSQKLAQKLKVAPKVCLPPDPNLFADWSAHLFTADRTPYIILTNTASLYSVLMYGNGIADDGDFIDAVLSAMREFLPQDGNEFIFRKLIAPASGEGRFSKALNRSVTGSMNDLISCGKFHLVQQGMSPFAAATALNEMPMSYLGYKIPRKMFKGLSIKESGMREVDGSSEAEETR